MANLNKVMLIGNVTRDPEIRYTPKGTALVELGLAVNRRSQSENGEWREEVTFITVTLWARQAEIANEYLRKGRPVFIEGRLQLDTWEDKAGQKQSRLRVVGENMQMLGSREGGGGGNYGNREGNGGNSGGYRDSGGEPDYDEPRPARQQSSRPPASRPAAPPKPPVDPDLDVEGDDIPF